MSLRIISPASSSRSAFFQAIADFDPDLALIGRHDQQHAVVEASAADTSTAEVQI